MAQICKKHTFNEYFEIYRRWGFFFLQTMEICINEKQVANKRKIVPPFQVTIIFG
jgi:hypothetical protein